MERTCGRNPFFLSHVTAGPSKKQHDGFFFTFKGLGVRCSAPAAQGVSERRQPCGHAGETENGTSHTVLLPRSLWRPKTWFRILQEEALDFARTYWALWVKP